MGIGLGTLIAGATLPFLAGEAISVGDRFGLDLSGETSRAGKRMRRQVNSAGWAGVMNARDAAFDKNLGVLSGTMKRAGDGDRSFLSGPDSSHSAFLQQLFAKEGMRLHAIGQEARQMSYLDLAAEQGLM